MPYKRKVPFSNRSNSKAGIIYLVKNSETGLHKIGITTNIKARVSSLKSQYSATVMLVHFRLIDGAGSLEHSLHRRFIGKHSFGEWFDLRDEDIVSAISAINDWSYRIPKRMTQQEMRDYVTTIQAMIEAYGPEKAKE